MITMVADYSSRRVARDSHASSSRWLAPHQSRFYLKVPKDLLVSVSLQLDSLSQRPGIDAFIGKHDRRVTSKPSRAIPLLEITASSHRQAYIYIHTTSLMPFTDYFGTDVPSLYLPKPAIVDAPSQVLEVQSIAPDAERSWFLDDSVVSGIYYLYSHF
jgi:hypothetical protein